MIDNTKPKWIALDYDGTVVELGTYPNQGKPVKDAIRVLKAITQAGHKLILWTCREDEGSNRKHLQVAVDLFKTNNIPLAAINETPMEYEYRDVKGRKVHADIYIDDRNLFGLPTWAEIYEYFFNKPLPPE